MMKQILFAGVIGLFLTLVGTPLLIKLLARKGYGQYIRDDGPREHHSKRGTPTMGGIAFILATIIAYFLSKLITGYSVTFSGLLVLGLMAGIAGLMQAHYAQEVVPNALYGRELDVLAATVLGGARLGGGKGSVIGCVLGVLMVSITQNGLNLMGVSPFAFKMIVGAIILIAITLSSTRFDKLLPAALRTSAKKGSAQR